ncbi:MAG: PadR family transcriptional regulator PadR [Saprospiraceae bacterium]|jgi:PadR family transcriptional regulator PadR|tara:strand:- start:1600 stop:1923 length:324 start_codon:yes stop_codon:yes gene_type:complete
MSTTKSTKSAIFKILVLGILYKEETYGYDIRDKIKILSNDEILMKEGTLYPLLKSLKSSQLLRSNWKKSKLGKARKYYSVTERGKAEYKRLIIEWNQMNSMIRNLQA